MKKRILACLLALVMLIGAMPVMALAAEPEAEKPASPASFDWEVSKSKTATALDADGSTRVTLSLPSAEENLASDVVFVLDTSDCVGEVMNQVSGLVAQLKAAQEKNNADIKVGVVAFKGSALPMFDGKLVSVEKAETTLNEMIQKVNAVTKTEDKENVVLNYLNADGDFLYKGSNLHSGLLGAQALLKDDGAVDDSRKYVVTITDGLTYYWNDKAGNVYAVYNDELEKPALPENDPKNWHKVNCLFYAWKSAHNIGSDYTLPSGFDWNNYISDVKNRITVDGDEFVSNLRQVCKKTNIDCGSARYFEGPAPIKTFTDAGFRYVPLNDGGKHALGIERSVVACLDTYQEMVKEGYQCYTVNAKDTSTFPGLFTSKLNEMAGVKGQINFDAIANTILYTVGVGSTVTDYMGYDTNNYNFDLVRDSLILTVGGQSLASLRDGNTYYFGDTGVNGVNKDNCRFKVVYTPENDGEEKFVWTINEAVSNFSRVQLSYQLRLRDDARTSTDGYFYTNVSATLKPKDSNNNEGEVQEFERPRVKFGSDTDYLLPILSLDKPAPKLNTRDHFAYVQGYPDGTVKPAGSITRAEVAAILFRLMDADSRSLYYSTASGFRDVDSTKWYNTYVATLNNAGVITDSRTGYFRPNDAITRAELAAMLAQFAEKKSAAIYFSDVSAGYWAANAIALTANLGWINGYPDGTFGPDKTVTRAELMAMVNRATGRAPKSTGALLSGMKTWKDNADTARWYYLDVQEATNSHTYTGAPTETWTSLTATPDWSQYE